MITALALVASMGAHFVDWSAPGLIVVQKGVAVGTPHVDERLILFSKDGECRSYVRFAGQYGDFTKAEHFLRHHGCQVPIHLPITKATGK